MCLSKFVTKQSQQKQFILIEHKSIYRNKLISSDSMKKSIDNDDDYDFTYKVHTQLY